MKLEHVAMNVEAPSAMAEWYTANLGLTPVKQLREPPYTVFMADESGRVMIELYNNPADQVPDYSRMDPLILHLAFVSEDPDGDRDRLSEAGARLVSDERLEDGSHLVMMRDPWGICIQLCKRATPMLRDTEDST